MKIFRRKKNIGKEKKPASIGAFHVLSSVLFFSFLLFLSLSILTGERSLRNLASRYVSSVEDIEREQLLYYKDLGISEDVARGFFSSKEFQKIVADVMADKLIVLFHQKESYAVSKKDCEDSLSQALQNYLQVYQIELSESNLESTKNYTMNMSGLSAMFIYDTPAAYKTSTFDYGSQYAELNNTFEVLAELASPIIPIVIFLMYVICTALLFVFMWNYKEIIPYKAADTAIIPSVILLAFCFGELFCMKEPSAVQVYIFRTGAMISIGGIVFGAVFFFIANKLSKINNKVYKEKNINIRH